MRNVVLFTIDTLRRDVFGCYGNRENLTAFLDSLEGDSLIYAQAHSVAPFTQASFPGILTSSYIFDAPRSPKLAPNRTLISEALQEHGVVTAAFHSNPYLGAYFGWNRGWDIFYDSMEEDVNDFNPYIKGMQLNEKVDRWLGSRSTDDPFFLWVHYMDVHEPYVPPEEFLQRIDGPPSLSKDEMFGLFKEVVLPRDVTNQQTIELLRKLYKAHVCEVDEYAKRFFDVLARNKVLSNTTVIITTDHGEEFGEHGGLSHDGKMYAELVHVPQLIVNPPEGKSSVYESLVSGLDIAPTIMSLFGFSPHANFQGQSLFPLDRSDRSVFGESIGKRHHKVRETDRPAYFYREGKLKVMYREEEDSWELYDLESDPFEKQNIADTSPSSEEMKQKLRPRIGREPAL